MTVAFALSGGGNLGAMQAGSVVALVEAGIEPDLLVGSSIGAMNAAFLCTRPGLEGARTLMSEWMRLRRQEVAGFSPLTVMAGFFGVRDHLVSSIRLRALMTRWVDLERIEDAVTPFVAMATDALTGEAVMLRRGDVVDALSASVAIPGLLAPVRIGDRWLIDGSLSA